MANNQKVIAGTEPYCEQVARIIARALGYPKREAIAGSTGRVPQPSDWNGYGNVPPGWSARPTTTWYKSASVCALPVDDAMAATLAAAPAQAALTLQDRDTLNTALAARATVDLSTYGDYCPGDLRRRVNHGPLMAICWDGGTSDHEVYAAKTGSNPRGVFNATPDLAKMFINAPHRKGANRSNGWDQYGPGIDSQAIADAYLRDVQGDSDPVSAIDAFIYDFYMPPSLYAPGSTNIPPQSYINTIFEKHRSSVYKSRCKFALMLTPPWMACDENPQDWSAPVMGTWGLLDALIAYLQAAFNDSQYLRIGGKPVVGMFYGANATYGMPADKWTYIQANLEPLYLVISDGDTTALQNLGGKCKTKYGPANGLPAYAVDLPTVGGLSQYPFSFQFALDHNSWNAVPGAAVACSYTPLQDRRPRVGGNTAYVDQPTMHEFFDLLHAGHTFVQPGVGSPVLGNLYAHTENGEAGPGIERNIQEGDKYLRWLKMYRSGIYSSDTYALDAHQLNFYKSGTWTYVQDLPGAWNSDVERSSSVGAAITFRHYKVTRYALLMTVGPGMGTFNVAIDGVTVASGVSLVAGSLSYAQVVWTSDPLTEGTHEIIVTVASGTVEYDACRITANP